MPRVYEVARELGLTSREVIAELNALGHDVTSHSSSVDDETVATLRTRLGNGRGAGAAGAGEGTFPGAPVDDAPTRVVEPDEPVFEQWRAPAGPDGVPAAPPRAEPHAPRPAAPPADAPRRRSWLVHQLIELPVLVALAFLIAIVIKTFVAQAFFIPSPSMRPTLREGDRVLVEKVSYRFGGPGRGHVVVFAKEVFGAPQDLPWPEDARNLVRELLGLPTGSEEDYIKRVVAVEGDVVRYAGKPRRLVVNGEAVDEPYLRGRDGNSQALRPRDCERLDMEARDRGCVVPDGTVFVMGDNRGNSEDSRVIGPISEDKIVGRAFVVIWPPRDWGGL